MAKKTNGKSEKEFKFESEKFAILPERGRKGSSYRFSFWFMSLARTNLLPRVIPNRWKDSFSLPLLADIARGLGFSSAETEEYLHDHQQRVNGRLTAYVLFAIPMIFLLIFVPMIALFILLTWNGFSIFLLVALLLLIVLPIELFLLKAIFVILDKYYADSLCVQASLGVLVELTRPQVLQDPSQKRYLLVYIREAARYTLLLPLCFRSPSKIVNESIQDRFHEIERFVREQEKLAILPTTNALDELRENFLMLTRIFIRADYGSFEWKAEPTETSQAADALPEKWYQRVLAATGKVIGLAVPLAGLYYAIVNPSVFSGLPIDIKSITLVAIAWLFLSIDSILQLGLTSRVVSTAKEIKDLM